MVGIQHPRGQNPDPPKGPKPPAPAGPDSSKTSSPVRPCEETCCKCGSSDIWSRFFSKACAAPAPVNTLDPDTNRLWEAMLAPHIERSQNPFITYFVFTHSVILQHCRCCQYDWVTYPLDEPKCES